MEVDLKPNKSQQIINSWDTKIKPPSTEIDSSTKENLKSQDTLNSEGRNP